MCDKISEDTSGSGLLMDGLSTDAFGVPSSSNIDPNDNVSVQAALTAFRDEWRKELNSETAPTEVTAKLKIEKTVEEERIEELARSLFIQGVENEQKGCLYEAIRFYKKAVQLVPDIEVKIYESARSNPKEKNEPPSVEKVHQNNDVVDSDTEDEVSDDSELELLPRLQKWLSRSHAICTFAQQQKATHISSLPMEILLYILRWVVSCDLDIRSLEMFSLVCKGFFICSRDSEIWRLICQSLWGVNCGGLSNHITWREMYLKRPHLNFTGCYISKTTYVRQGENSFQDQCYASWHLVEYFRYLRFFPEGKVLMLTTADSPIPVLGHLRYRNSKNPSVLTGHYRLTDDVISVILQRNDKGTNNRYMRGRRQNPDLIEQKFHIDLKVKPWKGRSNWQLVWTRYMVFSRRGATETVTNFEVMSNKFPPFWFSTVKSYNSESEQPLA